MSNVNGVNGDDVYHVIPLPLAYVEILTPDERLLSASLCKFELMACTFEHYGCHGLLWNKAGTANNSEDSRLGDLIFSFDGWGGFTSQNPLQTSRLLPSRCLGYLFADPPHMVDNSQPPGHGYPVAVVASTLVRVMQTNCLHHMGSIEQQWRGATEHLPLSPELQQRVLVQQPRLHELGRRLERATVAIPIGTTSDAYRVHLQARSRREALPKRIASYMGTGVATRAETTLTDVSLLEPVKVHASVDIHTVQVAAASVTNRFVVVNGGCREHSVAIHAAIVAAAVRSESVTLIVDQDASGTSDQLTGYGSVDGFPNDAGLYNRGSLGVVLWTCVCLVVRCRDDAAAFRFPADTAATKLQSLMSPDTQLTVGGNAEAQRALRDAFMRHPQLIAWGWQPPTGVLLYGPPGCGKTLLVRSVLHGVATVIHLKSTDVAHATVGAGEKTIAEAFSKAREKPPSVVFIDEFQALFTQRSSANSSRVTTTLLQCMDDLVRWRQAGDQAVGKNTTNPVIVIAATNTPWLVDRAFLRPGRFDRSIHVQLPNEEERKQILKIQMRSMRKKMSESHVDQLCSQIAKRTANYSGADLGALCRAAAVRCLVAEHPDAQSSVREEDLLEVLAGGEVPPSTSASLLQQINEWRLR